MGGHYPDGVTGNEPEIAGYVEREVEISEECHQCGDETSQIITVVLDYGEWVGEWTCTLCQRINSYSEAFEQTHDPDDFR